MADQVDAMPVRICDRCAAVYIEDARMYEDVNRCPHCGAYLAPDPPEPPEPVEI